MAAPEAAMRYLGMLVMLCGQGAALAQVAPIEAAVKTFEAADSVAARKAALDAIAALSGKAGAVAVSRALAAGLQDALPEVRAHAVPLVAKAPDRDIALSALVEACRYVADVEKRLKKPDVKQSDQPDARNGDAMREWFAEIRANNEKLVRYFLARAEELATLKPLIEVMGGWRDDRAVEGLAHLVRVAGPAEAGTRVRDALLAAGTGPALIAVTGYLEFFDKALAVHEAAVKKARRTRWRRAPETWQRTKDAWKEREKDRVRKLVEKAEGAMRATERQATAYADGIRAFAAKHDLRPPPRNEKVSSWKAWMRNVGKRLPESLAAVGGVEGVGK